MTAYRRVAYEDRCQIEAWIAAKKSQVEIAKRLGFDKSTISRELKRNNLGSEVAQYRPKEAQVFADERKRRCRRPERLRGELEQIVRNKLSQKWSPEQISGRLLRERKVRISVETIYRYIRARPSEASCWQQSLRRYKKRGAGRYLYRKKAALTPWKIPISKRPLLAQKRKRFGDWERDTMFGANRQMMLVCAERKSRFVKWDRVQEPKSLHLCRQTQELLDSSKLPHPLRSITNDNGGELQDGFAFKVPVYYCDPHSPQQRGTIENTIGLLRQYVPKGTDLTKLTAEEFKAIESAMNHRPRKCLDYRTPFEVFYGQTTVALAS